MPYKDPEKAREAKRKSDAKRRGAGVQHRYWWGYLYEDTAPADWETRIRESGYECVWATHDRDVRPTGESKVTHTHVAVAFNHAVGAGEAKAVLTDFGVKEASIQFRDSWRAVCRYMIHMDDPDKFQYSPDIVRQCGGADWETAISRTSDKYRTICEMQDWVDDPANRRANGCPPQFVDLMRHARRENREWFIALCDNCTVVMREYCKGARADWKDEVREMWKPIMAESIRAERTSGGPQEGEE